MAKLNNTVASQFELVNWTGGKRQIFGKKFGVVDLEKMTIPQAEKLVQMGFKKLKKKEVATNKPAPPK